MILVYSIAATPAVIGIAGALRLSVPKGKTWTLVEIRGKAQFEQSNQLIIYVNGEQSFTMAIKPSSKPIPVNFAYTEGTEITIHLNNIAAPTFPVCATVKVVQSD